MKYRTLVIATLGLLAARGAEAQAQQPRVPPHDGVGGLMDFLRLDEKLPRAVCDLSVISKAPTLESTRGRAADAAVPFAGRGYALTLEVEEHRLIRFLMDDPSVLLASRRLLDLWEQAAGQGRTGGGSGEELKRHIALEVCTAQVTPGKVRSLLDRKPDLFLPIRELSGAGEIPEPPPGGASFALRDAEGRYGLIRDRWWVAGWIEPFEVREARIGPRVYRRLSHPVTNQTRFIQVLDASGVPLGFLYPTHEETRSDWATLKAQGESPSARRKQNDAYRLLLEIDAYEALAKAHGKAEAIRDLQEFYKSLLSAYQIYPGDERFASYDRAIARDGVFSEEGPRRVLDGPFFAALDRAKLSGGAMIRFAYAKPDRRLHAIYLEYRKRLASL